MDVKQIKYFLEVSKTGSFTSAAKKLYISAPGLVKSMDKLEEEFHELKTAVAAAADDAAAAKAATEISAKTAEKVHTAVVELVNGLIK